MYEYLPIDENTQPIAEVKRLFYEYKRVRPYMSCDFYPLTENHLEDDVWCAWQFDRPEESDGVVLVFRRPRAAAVTCEFDLGGLDSGAEYEFTDSKGKSFSYTGGKFSVTLKSPRESEIYFYKKK